MTKRIAVFIYGVVSCAIFFATFLYAVGFVGNVAVPKSIDSPAQGPLWLALLIDAGLLGLFAIQHTIMARPAFKRWTTRFVPKAAERSTFTLVASLLLIALFVCWQPVGGVVWQVQDPAGKAVLYALFAFGWGLVLLATLLVNHFDLFGLRQVWLYVTGKEYTPLRFVTPWLYRIVRHPLYVGWFFAFWATPIMTVTHLVFAVLTSGYILIGIQFEERDLVAEHPEYADYRRRVPMLIPRLTGRLGRTAPTAEAA